MWLYNIIIALLLVVDSKACIASCFVFVFFYNFMYKINLIFKNFPIN